MVIQYNELRRRDIEHIVENIKSVMITKGSDGGTELTLIHELFTDVAQRDLHADDWQKCLDRIENLS